MQTNTHKRKRSITASRAGPSNIPQEFLDAVLAGGVSDTVRKVAEPIRGGNLITERDRAVVLLDT
jgi:hypothetical protein